MNSNNFISRISQILLAGPALLINAVASGYTETGKKRTGGRNHGGLQDTDY